MQHLLSVLCLIVAVFGGAFGWYNRMDNVVYGGYRPNRRSMNSYCEEDRICINSHQCCETQVCKVGSMSKYGFGRCENKEIIPRFGFKKEDEPCTDSRECADQCCRPIRKGFRMGLKYTCGKPQGYSCVYDNNETY